MENHENLRLMAGTIIREMVDNGLSANQFWDPKKYPDLPSIFENILEKSSQWTLDFVTFVDSLETQGFVSKEYVEWRARISLTDTRPGERYQHLPTQSFSVGESITRGLGCLFSSLLLTN